MHYTRAGQEVSEAPSGFQTAEQRAVLNIAEAAERLPVVFHFMWTLDADRRARLRLFTTADDMYAALRKKSSNFFYAFLFDKTGPAWPNPVTSLYGCHSPEWNGPSTFSRPQVSCPSTVTAGLTEVGQALGYTRAQNLQAARRSVGYAYGLFIRAGYTPRQAIQQINALVETFAALE